MAYGWNYWFTHQKDSVAKAAAQAHALEVAREAVARGEQLSVYPEWCDHHGSRVIAYFCESYLDSPIWCTVFILDAIALWLIFCILRRQRQQNQEDKHARLGPPKKVRVGRLWGRLAASVKLASYNATLSSIEDRGDKLSRFTKAFEEVSKARDHRKKYLWKKDYDLMAVMGQGMGPVVMTFTTALILFVTHAWFTLVLPSFGLPSSLFYLLGAVSAILPFRILLDYARTSFTDPGSPQAYSPRGHNLAEVGQDDEDIELSGATSSEVKKCHKCNGPKPRRCHHCKVCRRCVLKMDHHCPFVNNCVGLRNHRFFILFLLELVMACSILVVCLLPQLLVSLRGGPHQTLANRIHVITTFAIALICDSMLAPFFYFHMQLVIVNETTLENMKSRSERTEFKQRQRQLGAQLQKAEKAEDASKVQEIKVQLAADTAKEDVRRQAAKEDHARHSQGSFMGNFTEVFGAPPAAIRKRLEAILEWFNPAPTAKAKESKARSA